MAAPQEQNGKAFGAGYRRIDDMQVVSAIARNYNNRSLEEALGITGVNGPIYDDVVFALKSNRMC
ncbi:MAG: hypothetical protein R2794_06365 [Chitinophagales bacterium]